MPFFKPVHPFCGIISVETVLPSIILLHDIGLLTQPVSSQHDFHFLKGSCRAQEMRPGWPDHARELISIESQGYRNAPRNYLDIQLDLVTKRS
jgi:hypothetical protein